MNGVEIWVEIQDAPGYEVSNLGRVRSWFGRLGRRRDEPLILKFQANPKSPYPSVALTSASRKQIRRDVHRLVCIAFCGPPPTAQHEAAHNDGNRQSLAASNLRWATKKENENDKARHGTLLLGEKNPAVVLSEEIVNEMRALYASGGFSFRRLASRYGCGEGTASRAVKGQSWGHIGGSKPVDPFLDHRRSSRQRYGPPPTQPAGR